MIIDETERCIARIFLGKCVGCGIYLNYLKNKNNKLHLCPECYKYYKSKGYKEVK